MDKAIEIKRRAQRCILNGDLDGALNEYQKLVSAPDADPYHSVLLADLLYKKGDHGDAADRYFVAVAGYEAASLFKNAIAVCKKMSRLSLAPARVLEKLAQLHKSEGLPTEASLYFMQHAELMVRDEQFNAAIDSLRHGFDTSTDNLKALERLAEVQMLADKTADAVKTLDEAADRYNRQGQFADAVRCQDRAQGIGTGAGAATSAAADVEHGSSLTPDTGVASEPVGAVESVDEVGGPIDPNDQSAALDAAAESGSSAPAEDGSSYDEITIEAAGDAEEVRSGPALAPLLGSSPEPPGLQFSAPGGDSPAVGPPPAKIVEAVPRYVEAADQTSLENDEQDDAAAAAGEQDVLVNSMGDISKLLDKAQGCYARGEREAAGTVLVTAARAYDDLGHHDSAASIYRGLHDARQAHTQVMVLWLKNCKVRGDLTEAAQVACEIGDRTMTEGNPAEAREWFERAQTYDQSSELAASRLQRLDDPGAVVVATAEASEQEEDTDQREEDADDDAATATLDVAETNGVGQSDEVADMIEAAEADLLGASESDRSEEADSQATADDDESLIGEAHEIPGQEPESDGAEALEAAPPSSSGARDPGLDTQLGDGEPPDLGWLIAQFQRGVSEQLANDCRAHYDLGVSYREMGLLDEAVGSFREAANEPELVPVATEMIVRCLLDQGKLDNAVAELRTVLASDSLEAGAAVSLYYQMGLALEAGGRQAEALDAFQCVSDQAADYADVARKIRDLRAALGRS